MGLFGSTFPSFEVKNRDNLLNSHSSTSTSTSSGSVAIPPQEASTAPQPTHISSASTSNSPEPLQLDHESGSSAQRRSSADSPLTSPIFDPFGLSSPTSNASLNNHEMIQSSPSSLIKDQRRRDSSNDTGSRIQANAAEAEGKEVINDRESLFQRTLPDSIEPDSPKRGRRRRRTRESSGGGRNPSALATSPASLSSNWWDRDAVKQEIQAMEDQQSNQDESSSGNSSEGGEEEVEDPSKEEGSSSNLTQSSISQRPNLKLKSPFQTSNISSEKSSSNPFFKNHSNPNSPPHSQSPLPNSNSPPSISASPSNASLSIRSPAADFLSAFSSMHSVVPSPSNSFIEHGGTLDFNPINSRDSSLKPSSGIEESPSSIRHFKNSNHAYGASAPDNLDNSKTSPWNGLSSVAAQLYSSSNVNSKEERLNLSNNLPQSPAYPFNSHPLRPDDEGARIGPKGRFLLGKNIGFGGFSTIREGWDLGEIKDGEEKLEKDLGLKVNQLGRRVAVKLIYSSDEKSGDSRESDEKGKIKEDEGSLPQEVIIWKSLPSHPHILPLLHYERLSLGSNKSYADMLIMPFCDRGSLLDFVRCEGGRRFSKNGTLSTTASSFNLGISANETSLSRSTSLSASLSKNQNSHHVNLNSLGMRPSESARSPSSFTPTVGRTGSGFIPKSRAGSKELSPPESNSRSRNPSVGSSFSSSIPSQNQGEEQRSSPVQVLSNNQGSSSRLASPSPLNSLNQLGRSPSLSSSTVLRRASSRAPQPPRSQGVPIPLAREILSQITSALLSLHSKAGVRHGDIKLENVLGQSAGVGSKRRRRRNESGDSDLDQEEEEGNDQDPLSPLSPESEGAEDLNPTEAIFWRLADFGLAKKVSETSSPSSPVLTRKNKSHKEDGNSIHEINGSKVQSSKIDLSNGGSLAYTPPETLRADPTIANAAASNPSGSNPIPTFSCSSIDEIPPFASDMWALGCILYALLSGRLPFADSFEPRLQMKIARAQWETPPRLKRRAERLGANSQNSQNRSFNQMTSNPTSPMMGSLSSSNSSSGFFKNSGLVGRERSGSIELRARPPVRGIALGRSHGLTALNGRHQQMPLVDLSASLPALPPQHHSHQRHQTLQPLSIDFNRPGETANVVGSAPSAPDANSTSVLNHSHLEANQAAHLAVEMEEDPESDQDEGQDFEWNGTSHDRAKAREVLLGLLDPNPKTRWNIQQLSTCQWLYGFGSLSGLAAGGIGNGLGINNPSNSGMDGETLPTSLQDSLAQGGSSQISRPSLAELPISEYPSQERVAQLKDDREREIQREEEKDEDAMAPASPLVERIARANGLDTWTGRTRTPPPPSFSSDYSSNSSRSRSKSLAAANRNRREQNSSSPNHSKSQRNETSPFIGSTLSQSMGMGGGSSKWGGRIQDHEEEEEGDDEIQAMHPSFNESGEFLPKRYVSGPSQEAQHSWGGRAPSPLDSDSHRGRRANRMTDVDEDSVWALNHHREDTREEESAAFEETVRRGRQSPAIPISISRDASQSPVLGMRNPANQEIYSGVGSSTRRNRSSDPSLLSRGRRSNSRDTRSTSTSTSRSRSQIRPYSLSTTFATSDETSTSSLPPFSPIEKTQSSSSNSSTGSFQPQTSNVHAQRTSSSRSRSRAPEALANILRESSRERGSGSSGDGSRSRSRGGNIPVSGSNTPLDSEEDGKDNWWERGRGRERKESSRLSK